MHIIVGLEVWIMALNRIPVDVTAAPFSTATLALIRPKLDGDGVQRRTTENVPVWEYDLLIMPEGRRPEILPVSAPSRNTPSYTPGCRVSLLNCVAQHYSIRDAGRVVEGIAFSADSVTPVGANQKSE